MQRIANHQDRENFGSLGQKGVGVIEDLGRGGPCEKEIAALILLVRFSIICNEPSLLLQYFFFLRTD